MDESRKQFEEWFKNKYHVSSDVMMRRAINALYLVR